MRRSLRVGVLLGGLLAAGTVVAADLDGALVLSRWIDSQKEVRAIHITFRQERVLQGLRKPLSSDGELWLHRDGRMRWQMGDPPKTIAIHRDGEILVLRPEKRTAERRRLGEGDERSGEVERAFLETGLPDSREDFDKFFTLVSAKAEGAFDMVRIKPRDAEARRALRWIDLLVHRGRNELAGYDVVFRDESVIRTRFRTLRKNPSIDDKLFSPDLTGYEVGQAGR